jgi:ubiquinone/menaquinone biosynthesis C-methylase UbiE
MDDLLTEIRSYWDADAPTYNNARGHHPTSPAVLAAWAASLERLFGPDHISVLDVGAGTGFLSLIAARLGHKVTSLDLSPQMLERLRSTAKSEGLDIEVVVGNAAEPPTGFDAVMERHVLWTLQDPQTALVAWRRAAPEGRLFLIESLWGQVDPVEQMRRTALHALGLLRGTPPDHHASYSEEVRRSLPLAGGTAPSRLIEMSLAAGWRAPRLERMRDIEWAERSELPMPDRLIGVTPRFVVVAR